MVTRRVFASKLGGLFAALVGCFAIDQPATAAGQISFKAPTKGTVLVNTIRMFGSGKVRYTSKGLVYQVGSLSGRLLYYVNGRWVGVAAGKYTVAKGATITWKQI